MTPGGVFRRLLRLLPLDFRSDCGRDMAQVFRQQHEHTALSRN
jgi:hypothetical protein